MDNMPVLEGPRFFYLLLVKQELIYWINHPDELTKENFDAICERRGFNAEEIDMLKYAFTLHKLEIK
jgi:hypothetical protein